MNPIAKLVARVRVSIRVKLLVAFLGITCLMAGLALFGLSTLHQANARTEALLHDQTRIAFYTDVERAVSNMINYAFAAGGFEPAPGRTGERSFLENPTAILQGRRAELERELSQGLRRFGARRGADAQAIVEMRDRVRALAPTVERINQLRTDRALGAVRTTVISDFLPVAVRLQRDVYTFAQDIEAEMAATARATAHAYRASRQQIAGAAMATIGLALMIGYAMSSTLIWPVRQVGRALDSVASGRFDARVAVPNRDELGTLAENVNAMAARLAALYDEVEGQKTQLADWNARLEEKVAAQVTEIARVNRLRRFLPAQVADLITGTERETEALATRRGEITVLFADLRGFTGFANHAPPRQVVAALNAFHAACGPLIEAHGGTLERFLGDGVMVLFGAPLPVDDPAGRALALAREMRTAVRDALAPFRTGEETALGLGIGIASGAATLGQIGFEGRKDYAAIGPAPNLAARLCDKAGDGQILVSHATAWQAEAEMRPAGPFDLKGIGPDVAAFELV